MFSVKEISPAEAGKLKQEDNSVVFMDVREQIEYQRARINHPNLHLVPLTLLASRGISALPDQVMDKQKKIVVFCHHGVRSSQVVAWLDQQGWQNVLNMTGGIDAYARFVEPEVGRY